MINKNEEVNLPAVVTDIICLGIRIRFSVMQYCCYGSVLGLIILGTLSRYYYMHNITPC